MPISPLWSLNCWTDWDETWHRWLLCAVFLYNICCFHDFIETNAPIERHLITLIHHKKDVNTENCFQNGGRPPSWIWKNFHFWSHDLYLHVFRHLHSEFHVNWPIRRRDIDKKRFSIWRPSDILNLQNFDFFCQICTIGMEICICAPNVIEIG